MELREARVREAEAEAPEVRRIQVTSIHPSSVHSLQRRALEAGRAELRGMAQTLPSDHPRLAVLARLGFRELSDVEAEAEAEEAEGAMGSPAVEQVEQVAVAGMVPTAP